MLLISNTYTIQCQYMLLISNTYKIQCQYITDTLEIHRQYINELFTVLLLVFHSFGPHRKNVLVRQAWNTKPCHSGASYDLGPSHSPGIDVIQSAAITLPLTWITFSSRITFCCSASHWIRDSACVACSHHWQFPKYTCHWNDIKPGQVGIHLIKSPRLWFEQPIACDRA